MPAVEAHNAGVRVPSSSNLHPALSFLAILLLGIGLDRGFSPPYAERIPPLLRIGGGLGLVVLALALVAWGILSLRRARTPVEPGHTPSTLVTAGPYRLTRNPLYLGQLLFLTGLGLAAFPWLLAGALLQALLLDRLVIPSEERRIADHFGEAFEAYRRRVRRWI